MSDRQINSGDVTPNQSFQNGQPTSLTSICSISSINAFLESLIILLRDQERNKHILQKYELANLVLDIITIIKLFERKSTQDMNVKEQFDNKIKHISLNMELIVKLIYFTPCKLLNSSIHLIRAMLDYPRYKKLGVFAVYCIALMI